jgi:hypothetical protein
MIALTIDVSSSHRSMSMRIWVATTLALSMCPAVIAQVGSQPLKLYTLPPDAQLSINELAAQSDILILGEIHGTQEVPAVAATLLQPLTKLGYGVLALEVPADQQGPLSDWATGRTTSVPSFFAKPWEDGRGSIDALKLIRTALSPPFHWKLICFDITMDDMAQEIAEMNHDAKQRAQEKSASNLDSGQLIAVSLRRDAMTASSLSKQIQQLGLQHPPKVLTICGNLHARTENRGKPDKPWAALWPSFAAVLQSSHPTWHIGSVNISPHSGGFFNGGKVNTVKGHPLDNAEVRPTPEGSWNQSLDLPRATPATFLSTPDDSNAAPPPLSTEADKATRVCAAVQRRPQCIPWNRLRRRRHTSRSRTATWYGDRWSSKPVGTAFDSWEAPRIHRFLTLHRAGPQISSSDAVYQPDRVNRYASGDNHQQPSGVVFHRNGRIMTKDRATFAHNPPSGRRCAAPSYEQVGLVLHRTRTRPYNRRHLRRRPDFRELLCRLVSPSHAVNW